MKIIDVLNKMADGTLEDGFEFIFLENHFCYKENKIINIQNELTIGSLVALDVYLNYSIEVIEKPEKIEGLNSYYNIWEKDSSYIVEKINEIASKLNRLLEREED